MSPQRSSQTRPNHVAAIRAAETKVRKALSEGRVFAAYDLASKGLETETNADVLRLLAAIALVRSGAVQAARDQIGLTAIAAAEPESMEMESEQGLLLAEALEEIWQISGQTADRDRALAIRLQRARQNGSFPDMARAALLTQAGDDRLHARDLAQEALKRAEADPDKGTMRLLDLAELALIVGQRSQAAKQLRQLAKRWADRPLKRAQGRRRLEALAAQGVAIDPQLIGLFDPPTLLVFAGIRLQEPGGGGFSGALEQPLASAIADAMATLQPAIAYGSAAAGCDLLFCEALLARGTELNIILPFQRDSFRDRLVAPHGSAWLARFERVLAEAASITEVCQEHYLGDDAILRFGNQVIDGTARLRGMALSSPPYLVAIWDYLAAPFPGSPNDFIDHWGDPARLRLIGLDEIAEQAGTEPTTPSKAPVIPHRPAMAGDGNADQQRIASMLFADVAGFSRLRDDQLPLFWRFMKAVALHLGADVPPPRMVDSWGDAILTLHDTALASAGYATALASAFNAIDGRHFGLPEPLRLRIGLHAGPIFEGDHPLTGRPVIYGGNVNRAARIEPITVPGLVYASEQFVAALTAEESALEAETQLVGGTYRPRYRCIYRGNLELPKGYGTQAVYEVEPWRDGGTGQAVVEPGKRLHAILANEVSEHRRLAELFNQMIEPLSLSGQSRGPFELAFDEIVTNICTYAWQDDARHTIDVEIEVREHVIQATFSDDGAAFNPLETTTAALDADIDDRTPGGLGIHLVGQLMDEVRYRRVGNINRLTIVKNWRELGRSKDSGEQQA